MRPLRLSPKFRQPFWCAAFWLVFTALFSSMALDMGESGQVFVYTLIVYVILLLILLRRAVDPTRLDLILTAWAIPIFFFGGLTLLPLAWRLRGIYP